MVKPIWNIVNPAGIRAWSAIPEELRNLLAEDDDRDDVADSLYHLRAAGLDVMRPDVFALAVQGARAKRGQPAAPVRGEHPSYPAGEWARRRASRSVVYYARIGDRVKIGYSHDVATRMRAINPEELMTTEPGGPKREAERHRQFAALRTHGEWFRLEDPLLSHIAALVGAT